ncbi:1249_t:CDS:2 [Ambispora gerdemannii]|uniref:1249_t:CDS:1 n=1 Tax=Ambispora gerdemannii TaxID=144530 RepID=A0A9N9C634_9GLOM|nr:1249_t:CDS:2 [Ambispora gerdemannii]
MAKRVWNMVRNDGTPDEKFLGITPREKKKEQLRERLGIIAYIVAFIVLHRQDYKIVNYDDWSYMLKWLPNPGYYRINEYTNNGNENFVRFSEYERYRCRIAGKQYPCNSLKIDYFQSGYFTIEGKDNDPGYYLNSKENLNRKFLVKYHRCGSYSMQSACTDRLVNVPPAHLCGCSRRSMKRSWEFLIPKYYHYNFENFYATVIQRAYRDYKRPESLAKRVWEVVRNDGTPDDMK